MVQRLGSSHEGPVHEHGCALATLLRMLAFSDFMAGSGRQSTVAPYTFSDRRVVLQLLRQSARVLTARKETMSDYDIQYLPCIIFDLHT